MALTTYLAELLGLYIALMGVVMIAKTKAMKELMAAFVDHRALMYVLAMLRVLIGLAIVLGHNRWSGALPTVVTLLGWLILLRGIALLLLSHETERKVLAFLTLPSASGPGSGPRPRLRDSRRSHSPLASHRLKRHRVPRVSMKRSA